MASAKGERERFVKDIRTMVSEVMTDLDEFRTNAEPLVQKAKQSYDYLNRLVARLDAKKDKKMVGSINAVIGEIRAHLTAQARRDLSSANLIDYVIAVRELMQNLRTVMSDLERDTKNYVARGDGAPMIKRRVEANVALIWENLDRFERFRNFAETSVAEFQNWCDSTVQSLLESVRKYLEVPPPKIKEEKEGEVKGDEDILEELDTI